MRHFCILGLITIMLSTWCGPAAHAETRGGGAGAHRVGGQEPVPAVSQRGRLPAPCRRRRGDGLLAAEGCLARESDGRGWARDTVERLCVDRAGKLLETCDRDGTQEDLSGAARPSHRRRARRHRAAQYRLRLELRRRQRHRRGETMARCEEEVKLRVPYGRTTLASVDILLPDGTAQRVVTDIQVRDVLIAGLGDSIAAGEGNPDRPVRLSDEGFCFQRFLGTCAANITGPGATASPATSPAAPGAATNARSQRWARQSARWESGPCHRSLYGYQMRTALGLAVENTPHRGHLPAARLLRRQDRRRVSSAASASANARAPAPMRPARDSSPAQIDELDELMAKARRHQRRPQLDLVLLTIGANDILFSGLIANVIIESTTDRILLGRGGAIATVEDSQKILDNDLPGNFAKLRAALKPLVGGDLVARRVRDLRQSGAHLRQHALPRRARRLRRASGVRGQRRPACTRSRISLGRQFLPKIKALALCEGGGLPRSATDRMTFVDAHQAAFANHGLCARVERRSGIRPRLLLAQGRQLPRPIRARPRSIRWPADGRRASTAPMRRARAGSGPPTTATSPR